MQNTATPVKATAQREPGRRLTRRIGNTTYTVSVYLSETSRETMNDKIMRMVRNDAILGKAVGE
jgi:hypothetical protein